MTVTKRLIDDLDLNQPKAKLWKSEMALARMAFAENKLADASRLIHKAMEMSGELKEHDFAKGICHLGLALIAEANKKAKDAEHEFEKAINTGRSDRDAQHLALLGVALRHYANFAWDQNDKKKAEHLLEESYKVLQDAGVDAAYHLALSICDLSAVYITQGQSTKAQSLLPTAIEILQNLVESADDVDYSRASFLFEATMTSPEEEEFMTLWQNNVTKMQYQTGLKHPFFVRVLNRIGRTAKDAGNQDLIDMLGKIFSK